MQDQFDFENNNEQIERMKKEESAKKLRIAANCIGWATTVLVTVWIAIITLVSAVLSVLNKYISGFSGSAFYDKFYIVINEVALALAIAVALLILRTIPKADIQREKSTAGSFFKILVMAFGAGYIGNQIGTFILTFWNSFTGNSVGDELTSMLSETSPLIMFVSVGILAPIFEELFFRKLLSDRLQEFGELTAIIIPAFLFAMFHQSASQLLYAFLIGILIGYYYCRTGKYWLAVLMHSVFNIISGVIPMLYLPKITGFLTEIQKLVSDDASAGSESLAELMIPLFEQYGLALILFAIHSMIVFAINIVGVVLLLVNFKKYRERKGKCSLSFEESFNIVFRTPGIFVCTIFLSIMTIISLFV